MDTDKINIELHPRDNWQAFDLGAKLAIAWWKPLYGFWFLAALPALLVGMLVSPEWGILLLWWLKPLFEVGLLHILSRNIFQQKTGIKDTFRVYFKLLLPILIPALTWRRLSPSRGFNLAVSQLEGLNGSDRSKRLNVLHRRNNGVYWWLIICVHVETFIMFSLYSLLMMLAPEGSAFSVFDFIYSESDTRFYISSVFAFIGMWMMAPVFQAGSFIAYLNRRVILEGWDIEIQFKSIAKSLQKVVKPSMSVLFAFLVLGLSNATVNKVYATEQETIQSEEVLHFDEALPGEVEFNELTEAELAQQATADAKALALKERLDEIMSKDPFSEEVTTYDWEWTGWEWEEPEPSDANFPGLIAFFSAVAKYIEVIFWVMFVGILAAILWLTRGHIMRLFNISKKNEQTNEQVILPDFVASEAIQNNSVPQDFASAVQNALETQNGRLCLSLILISSLKEIQSLYTLELHRSNTETECLNKIVAISTEAEANYFRRLFSLWIQIAWSHNTTDIEQVQQLVDEWQSFVPPRKGGK